MDPWSRSTSVASGSTTCTGSSGGTKASTSACVGNVHPLDRVGEDEPVNAAHHWHRHFFGQTEGLDVQVDRFLVGLRQTAASSRHRAWTWRPSGSFQMLMGAPMARGAERHHDRQPEAGSVVDGFGHEQQALARRCGIGPRSRRRRTDARGQGAELGLDVDEFAGFQFAGANRSAPGLRRYESAA